MAARPPSHERPHPDPTHPTRFPPGNPGNDAGAVAVERRTSQAGASRQTSSCRSSERPLTVDIGQRQRWAVESIAPFHRNLVSTTGVCSTAHPVGGARRSVDQHQGETAGACRRSLAPFRAWMQIASRCRPPGCRPPRRAPGTVGTLAYSPRASARWTGALAERVTVFGDHGASSGSTVDRAHRCSRHAVSSTSRGDARSSGVV